MPPDARVCEIGWVDVYSPYSTEWEVSELTGMLVNPGIPMPPEARSIHHISDADLVGAPPITTGFLALSKGEPDVFVAHNAAFEQAFFTGGDTKWICTLKVARRLWPECPSHSNQCLRYWLGLELDDALAMPPHRAAPDAFVTAHILVEALKIATVEQMIQWTSEPSLLPSVSFGMHRGKAWADLPYDYLGWIVNKSNMDADTKFTAKHWMSERAR